MQQPLCLEFLPTRQENLELIGVPTPSGTGFQPAVTELARDLQWLDGMLLIIITAISLFVVFLLGYVIFKFNRKANPEPSSFRTIHQLK